MCQLDDGPARWEMDVGWALPAAPYQPTKPIDRRSASQCAARQADRDNAATVRRWAEGAWLAARTVVRVHVVFAAELSPAPSHTPPLLPTIAFRHPHKRDHECRQVRPDQWPPYPARAIRTARAEYIRTMPPQTIRRQWPPF